MLYAISPSLYQPDSHCCSVYEKVGAMHSCNSSLKADRLYYLLFRIFVFLKKLPPEEVTSSEVCLHSTASTIAPPSPTKCGSLVTVPGPHRLLSSLCQTHPHLPPRCCWIWPCTHSLLKHAISTQYLILTNLLLREADDQFSKQ